MKYLYIFGLLLFFFGQISAQSDTAQIPYDLKIEVGAYYKLFDYIGGFGINAVVYSPSKRMSYALRNRFLLSIEKAPTQGGTYTDYFVISEFHTMNYLEADYCWNLGKKHLVETGLGLGWVYSGEKENIKLNTDYGYCVLSGSVNYKVTWFYLELRGDLPIITKYKDYNLGPVKLFPVTFGIFYRFKPGPD